MATGTIQLDAYLYDKVVRDIIQGNSSRTYRIQSGMCAVFYKRATRWGIILADYYSNGTAEIVGETGTGISATMATDDSGYNRLLTVTNNLSVALSVLALGVSDSWGGVITNLLYCLRGLATGAWHDRNDSKTHGTYGWIYKRNDSSGRNSYNKLFSLSSDRQNVSMLGDVRVHWMGRFGLSIQCYNQESMDLAGRQYINFRPKLHRVLPVLLTRKAVIAA